MKKLLAPLVLRYLRFYSRIQLRKYAPDVVGITGSAGKTSARNAVYAVLKTKYKTKMSVKANSETGIPLNILGLSMLRYDWLEWLQVLLLTPIRLLTLWEPHEKYVVEMGIDSPEPPKNMEYLLTIVQPRTAVFLNVQPMHSQFFDPLAKEIDPARRREEIRGLIAKEKGKLITSLPGNGLAILNADDDKVSEFGTNTRAQVMWFGKKVDDEQELHVGFESVKQTLDGTKIGFAAGEERIMAHFPTLLLPDHFGYTLAAALCVALDEDYTLAEGVELLEKHFVMPPGRSTLIPGIKGSVVIDSSYNASAKPTIDALRMAKSLNGGRTLAILGDMRELGDESRHEHEMVLKTALETCDMLWLVGPLMREHGLQFAGDNNPGEVQISWCANANLAADKLEEELRPGDVLLIKGSQNTIFLEQAVMRLMRRKNDANKVLCRRGEFWDKERMRVFGSLMD